MHINSTAKHTYGTVHSTKILMIRSNSISSNKKWLSRQSISFLNQHNNNSLRRNSATCFGSYILGQTIGEGEFAKVKSAVHIKTKELVAIKMVKRNNNNSNSQNSKQTEDYLKKVNQEIDILKSIDHPNIIKIHDVIYTEDTIGIVMSNANGGELFDYVCKKRYLNEDEAGLLFNQLINAVDYLHKNGIVHRDLKLENVLLDKDGNILLTDFGFASWIKKSNGNANSNYFKTSCGSPCYAAPELVISGSYDGPTADIWSCGVILFAMLAGYLPFDDDPRNPNSANVNLLYKYILSTKLHFPSQISAEARDLLKSILVPFPEKRADITYIKSHPWFKRYSPIEITADHPMTIDTKPIPIPSSHSLMNLNPITATGNHQNLHHQQQLDITAITPKSASFSMKKPNYFKSLFSKISNKNKSPPSSFSAITTMNESITIPTTEQECSRIFFVNCLVAESDLLASLKWY